MSKDILGTRWLRDLVLLFLEGQYTFSGRSAIVFFLVLVVIFIRSHGHGDHGSRRTGSCRCRGTYHPKSSYAVEFE